MTLRDATEGDLDALMLLFTDDPISAARGDIGAGDDRPAYLVALRTTTSNPASALLVVVDAFDSVVGRMQLRASREWLGVNQHASWLRPCESVAINVRTALEVR